MNYVCSTKIDDETTESLWIIDGHMVIHTMSVDNYGNVIKENITNPNIDPADLIYNPAETKWV